MTEAIVIDRLSHAYPATRRMKEPRRALKDISLSIAEGEMFCLLGPNGSGKSTLFRILSTNLRPTTGAVHVFGQELSAHTDEIRQSIGIVFQNASLDKKLTVRENLLHQGHLYGMRGERLKSRIEEMLKKVDLLNRSSELIEHLSGGMQRRVELAKGLLHQPKLILLDEPSTGLDPGARKDFGEYLLHLKKTEHVTILLTSHILDEAEICDRLAILDEGSLVALGSPDALKQEIGGDMISVHTSDAEALGIMIQSMFNGNASPQVLDNLVRIERPNGHEFIPQLVQSFSGQIDSITLSKPTLEDVFIQKTGHRFWNSDEGIKENY